MNFGNSLTSADIEFFESDWSTTSSTKFIINKPQPIRLNRQQYEDNLKQRQEQHLQRIRDQQENRFWKPCAHDSCPSCIGTGIKVNGEICVHHLYCSCPKCTPTFMSI